MPSASLATLLLCLALAPASPHTAVAAPPVSPDSPAPTPPDSPKAPPAPKDSPTSPDSPDSEPVSEDSPPVPPDSPDAAPSPVPRDSSSPTSDSTDPAADTDRAAAKSSGLTWTLDPPPGPPPPKLKLAPIEPMRVRLAVDLPIIGAGLALALGSEFIAKEQTWAGCGACDRTRINALDRTALGNHNPTARTVSDVGLFSLVALPFVLDLGDVLIQRSRDRTSTRPRHLRGWGKDIVVLLETFAVTYATTNVVKLAVRRPRPYSYEFDSAVAEPTENDARLSFFSGHSSMAFAMATSYAYLFQTRHPSSRWVAPVWVLGMSLASVTAVARVEAGKHFWTDVMVGAAVGTGIGLIVPALHRSRVLGGNVGLQVSPTRTGSLLLLQGRF